MKTSEFIEKVEKLGFIYTVLNDNDYTIIVRSFRGDLMKIREHEYFMIDNFYPAFENLTDNQKDLLMSVVIDYLKTPITERKDKTIEDKAREYIQECINENHNFYSCVDNLLFNAGNDRESEIYLYYQTNSNEFVKLWCEVAADEH